MVRNPSKGYVLEGFPRTLEQAKVFEENVVEFHQVISLELSCKEMV